MKNYSENLLPEVVERVLSGPAMTELKRTLLAHASGTVLELGVGTGLNFALYPRAVEKIVALDPNPGMLAKAKERAATCTIPVVLMETTAEDLALGQAQATQFDTVVSTFCLCTVGDPLRVLRNVRRLVDSGSRFLFIEHGLSPYPGWRLAQRILNPAERLFGGGCNLTRDVPRLLAEAGLSIQPIDGLTMPKTSGLIYLTAGQTATPSRFEMKDNGIHRE